MKMVKSLTKANVSKYGIDVREDYNFEDDGNHFRGFSYKGMPMTQCRADNTTYLTIRVDYLENQFTYNEWMATEEWKLTRKFNGVSEFDIEELIEILEKIIAKVNEMNAAAESEELDMTAVVEALKTEIYDAQEVVDNFKQNFKWYDADPRRLSQLIDYMKSEERIIKGCKETLTEIDSKSRRTKKTMIESLAKYGYVCIQRESFYLNQMRKAMEEQ